MNRWASSSLIRFFGGKNLIYLLGVILLVGLNILVYTKVSFIFHPLVTLIKTIVLPSVLATVAYYLLRPLVGLMEKAGIKRVWGILIALVVLIGLISLLIVLMVPFFQRQVMSLAAEFPQYLKELGNSIDQWIRNSMFANYYDDLFSHLNGVLDSPLKNLSAYKGEAIEGVTNFISQLTSVVIAIITLPFILFYLLKEGEKFPKKVLKLLPPKMRSDVKDVFRGIDHQLSAYIQGQMLVSFSIGVMMGIGFLIIGLNYPFLLAAIASVTSVVPYLGPAIAITPALIIAIVTSPFMLFKLIVVWTVVQLLEGKLISPQIMGKRLHIHPVTIIFILLTAGHLFGVLGIIIAIPGYAILKVVAGHTYYLFQRRYNRYVKEDSQYDIYS
ncbi:AI-2E family transporter [Tuberibacillus sp. Marseille-P3662]|uniref:AI-2E family transporter n=1 Tax=Tuberibacillus sp. Marseille-P3662 TaxID=1965358 RepID=UPI000A1C9EE1|nr:AI-2E family transporter [Tuberibacillus sp. Marseille-P3662]